MDFISGTARRTTSRSCSACSPPACSSVAAERSRRRSSRRQASRQARRTISSRRPRAGCIRAPPGAIRISPASGRSRTASTSCAIARAAVDLDVAALVAAQRPRPRRAHRGADGSRRAIRTILQLFLTERSTRLQSIAPWASARRATPPRRRSRARRQTVGSGAAERRDRPDVSRAADVDDRRPAERQAAGAHARKASVARR